MNKNFFQSKSYQQFIEGLKKITKDEEAFSELAQNQRTLQSHWKKAKKIAQFKTKVPHGEKEEYYKQVAKDLKYKRTHVFLLLKFYEVYSQGVPQFEGSERLYWAHYVELIGVASKSKRDFYLELTAQENLSRDRLRKAIKEKLYEKLKEEKSTKHPNGILKRPTNPAFIFIADPKTLENSDVDTLDALLDQGFRSWHRDTFRLRGINGPEMHGPQHELALRGKEFLSKELKNAALIIIKTYKTDKYGRYIADVIYHPVWTDVEKVFKEGIYLNQLLLDKSLAKLAVY